MTNVDELIERLGDLAGEFQASIEDAVEKNAAGKPHRLNDHLAFASRVMELKDTADDIAAALRDDPSTGGRMIRFYAEVIAWHFGVALNAIHRSYLQPTNEELALAANEPLGWARIGAQFLARDYQQQLGQADKSRRLD